MNILLTGASGLLGSAFAEVAARKGHTVVGVVHRFTGRVPGLHKQLTVELASAEAVRSLLQHTTADAIVNCAAISSIGECEANPGLARQINVELPAALAAAAGRARFRLVHISSEQVFDGKQTAPYKREDPTSPINAYGCLKVESEQRVHELAPEHAVTVRPPLLLGNSLSTSRGIHEQFVLTWRRGETVRVFDDEYRQPCTVTNLSDVLLELCARPDVRGVFHWAGTNLVSRYELAAAIRARFDLRPDAAPLARQSRAQVPDVARTRPACLAQDISALAHAVQTRPEPLDTQLATLRLPPQG